MIEKLSKYLLTGMMVLHSIFPANGAKNNLESKLETTTVNEFAIKNIEYKNNIINFPLEELITEKEEIKKFARENKQPEYIPTDSEILKLSQIIYAEAADQSNDAWGDIVQLVKNRKDSPNYPNSIEKVIEQSGAFSCIGDKNNNNWNQAIGETSMNGYENNVFNKIKEQVKYALTKTEKVSPEKKQIIAYHDWSIHKPKDSYWNSLDKTHEDGKLIFYAPKEELAKLSKESTVVYSSNTKETGSNNLYKNNVIDASEKFGLLARAEKINEDNIINFKEARGLLAKAEEIKKAA